MAKSESTDNVVKEFKPVGKYRVRLLEWKEKLVLDVREYVEEETYTGFTKRGIRLSRDEAATLKDTLEAMLAAKKVKKG